MKLLPSVLSVLALAWATPAFAHAHPERTSPARNATVPVAPATVSIWFDDDVQPAMTHVEVKLDGKVVSVGKGKVDAKSPKLLSVPIAHAGAGKYTVSWHAVADDGHPSKGTFQFTVKAAGSKATKP